MALTKVTSGGISDIAAAVEGASDSNKFTDADHSKLNAIEASATADQTNAEIKAAVEAATDSNTFTDADHTKLNGVAASANNYVHPNHSGDVVSAADGAMTIQTDAVDIAMLSATGTASNTTFLRGDNAWATAGSTSASDLTSGTLPDARFPSTLPAISGANLTGITGTTTRVHAFSTNAAGDLLWTHSENSLSLQNGSGVDIYKDVVVGSSDQTYSINSDGQLICTYT